MKDVNQYLREYVLGAISDDYESFETILADIDRWAAKGRAVVDRQKVLKALEELIGEGYAQAFSFEFPFKEAIPTEYSAKSVDDLWFYVTPKGKQLAYDLQEEWR